MYMRFSALVPVAALAAIAAAVPSELEARDTVSQCNTGPIQCCQNTYNQTDPTLTSLASTLGIVLPNIGGLIALGCSPITGLGTGTGAVCLQQPVCCTNNTYNGLINLGCSPINLNL